jgi:pantoate--beta-alanine ligase
MILYTPAELSAFIDPLKHKGRTVGFVPTMGALHKGHITLAAQALHECSIVVISIFVNPTQFNKPEDLEHYPRTLQADAMLIAQLDPNIIIFAPTARDLYGDRVVAKSYDFGVIATAMEGQFRPGHFDGVGTVVNLLFRAVNPDKAYFGEKDYQQLKVVEKLVEIEALPVQIVPCAIARNPEGLALSSRNARLTASERAQATIIYRMLKEAQSRFASEDIPAIQALLQQTFAQEENMELEYFDIAPVDTLLPSVNKAKNIKYRAFIAVMISGIRLIDNMQLN